MRKPRRCPSCRSDQVRRIVYGYPDDELIAQAEAGQVIIGGCLIHNELPTWACVACGQEGGRYDDYGAYGRAVRQQRAEMSPERA